MFFQRSLIMRILLLSIKFVIGILAQQEISTLDQHLPISSMNKEEVLYQPHMMETPFILGILLANLNMKSLALFKK